METMQVDEMFEFSLRRDKLYKQVADRIQQLILAQSLRPGDKLPGERELAEQMDVSRTVVREALRVLSDRGLVKVKSGCGTYIRELSAQDATASLELFIKLKSSPARLENLYQVRRMIEVEAAGLAAQRATEKDLEAVEAAIEGMAAHQDDPQEYARWDLAFHKAIVTATGNDLFSVLITPISDLLQEMVRVSLGAPGAIADGLAYHRQILECIKDRDQDRARQAMRAHLDHARGLVETVRTQVEGQLGR
jgi:GntR family transcriptional repressor for pyruvate dehydrogenase complex